MRYNKKYQIEKKAKSYSKARVKINWVIKHSNASVQRTPDVTYQQANRPYDNSRRNPPVSEIRVCHARRDALSFHSYEKVDIERCRYRLCVTSDQRAAGAGSKAGAVYKLPSRHSLVTRRAASPAHVSTQIIEPSADIVPLRDDCPPSRLEIRPIDLLLTRCTRQPREHFYGSL